MFNRPNEAELAWLAGLLEGEGCFYQTGYSKHTEKFSPVIQLAMSDRDVVERAAELIGTRGDVKQVKHSPSVLKATPNAKSIYRFRVSGEIAVGVLKTLMPWFCERRTARAKELIAAWESHPHRQLGESRRRWRSFEG